MVPPACPADEVCDLEVGGGVAGASRCQDQLWVRGLWQSGSARKQSTSPEAAPCAMAASDRGWPLELQNAGFVSLPTSAVCMHSFIQHCISLGRGAEKPSELGAALPLG